VAQEDMPFLIAYLRVGECILPIMLNQFAGDFLISQAIFDDNLNKNSLLSSGNNVQKVDMNKYI
jgi:hypothetical protein